MNYYYFAASLPMLHPEVAPALSGETFHALCREHLTSADFEAITALRDSTPHTHPFLRAWQDKETQLRNALVRVRAAGRNRDATPFLRPVEQVDVAVEKAAADAYGRATPLERERALDRHRWNVANDLAGYDAFALEAILAYAVQLRLAERWARMDETEGKNRAQAIVAQQPAA